MGGAAAPPPPTPPLDFRMFAENKAPVLASLHLRTSWGGLPPPPTPPLAFSMFAKKSTHTLNRHFFGWCIDFVAGAALSAFGCVFAWQGQHMAAV